MTVLIPLTHNALSVLKAIKVEFVNVHAYNAYSKCLLCVDSLTILPHLKLESCSSEKSKIADGYTQSKLLE